MSLRLLLDEHITPAVAVQIRRHRPGVEGTDALFVESVHTWRNGAFLGKRDEDLMRAARDERLTLVTYDQNTIPPLFFEFVQRHEDHGGVIFVDSLTIRPDDVGLLVRSLLAYGDAHRDWDWTNRVTYLTRG